MRRPVVFAVLVLVLLLVAPAVAAASTASRGGPAAPVGGTSSTLLSGSWATLADVSTPSVTAIDPASARDDGDTTVTITGSGFVDTPTVTLGSTALTNVTLVDDQTLTATVPGGMDPGVYSLTVVNPDNGSSTLTDAFAVTAVVPTVSAVSPALGANDIDTSVTISGSDFVATPLVSLGSTVLANVTVVSSTTLTATVPWGLSAGACDLTVVNPDGSSKTLPGAFTVTQGIGLWNAGDLFGGQIDQLLMKPGDPATIYALAYGVIGLFRSDDAGDSWAFVSDKAWANNNRFAVDQLHPDDVYAFAPNGLMRSQDEGATWTTLWPNIWPDGRAMHSPQVYVSPYEDATHPQALWVSSSESYGGSDDGGAYGLTTLTNGGKDWTIVPTLDGEKVQDIAFAPDAAHHGDMVLVTLDMHVFTSGDWGATWTQVQTSGLTPSSLGLRGSISYDPSGTDVLIDSFASPGGIFECPAADIYNASPTDVTSWQDVSQRSGNGSAGLAFTSDTSVYIPGFHSVDGGATWQPFGPSGQYGYGAVLPTDALTVYIGNDAVGVQKTTDGGATWDDKSVGLTGLACNSMDVSKVDPLRVYATFNGPAGIYRSDDGTSHWNYLPVAGSWNVRQVLVDPFDPQVVYMGADPGFYESTDGGAHWAAKGWNLAPASAGPVLVTMAADPHDAGHLLASFGGGSYGVGPGYLYSSDDHGDSWQAVTGMPQGAHWIHSIVFDPDTSGLVYLTTGGTGVYKSTDSGATWTRIDDLQQPDMANASSIAIATGPQPMLIAGVSPNPYRSLDGGATWQMAGRLPSGGANLMFVNNDSTRLYFASPQGLFFSSDAGDTWERAAGAFGQLQTTALGYADADGHAILYAATNGGDSAAAGTPATTRRMGALSTANTLVGAGIYRYAQVTGRTTTCALAKNSATIAYGARTAVTGKLTDSAMGVRGCSVRLQSSSNGTTFSDTGAEATTTAGGAFTFTVAPTAKTFYRVSFTGSGDYYRASVSATISLTPRVSLTTPTAPSTARRSRAFTSVAYLKPLHRAGTYPVKLLWYRYERQSHGGYRWVLRKTVSARAADYSTYTKVTVKLSLPYTGKWRMRAYHAADVKNAATYSGYRYLSVR